jgi:hypothetical protein
LLECDLLSASRFVQSSLADPISGVFHRIRRAARLLRTRRRLELLGPLLHLAVLLGGLLLRLTLELLYLAQLVSGGSALPFR